MYQLNTTEKASSELTDSGSYYYQDSVSLRSLDASLYVAGEIAAPMLISFTRLG